MDPASDDYDRINPDSPWRWVPVIVFLVWFVPLEIAVRAELGWLATTALCVLIVGMLALAIVAWFRVGSGTPSDVAQARARETGGVRLATVPALAPAMISLGFAMIVAWTFALLFLDWKSASQRPWIEQVVWSLSFPVIAVLLIKYGRERPWDLTVVESEPRADEVTA